MNRKTIICSILFFGLIFSFCPVAFADETGEAVVNPHEAVEDEALKAAEEWLLLVDAGKYKESWKQAAEFFKNQVSVKEWKGSMKASRKPLGDLVTRIFKSKKFFETLPGAPDGKYVVVQFNTSFTNKERAVETVTPMLDSDGKWRVVGYYVR